MLSRTSLCVVLEGWIYLYYLNWWFIRIHHGQFLRAEFICIIWTEFGFIHSRFLFLRAEFICIIWTIIIVINIYSVFLRAEFICIIWTDALNEYLKDGFLRAEFICIIWTNRQCNGLIDGSWGLNLFVLFEHLIDLKVEDRVLEGWIYLYYLNKPWSQWRVY